MNKREREEETLEEPTSKETKIEEPTNNDAEITEKPKNIKKEAFCEAIKKMIGERLYNHKHTLHGPIKWSKHYKGFKEEFGDEIDICKLLSVFIGWFLATMYGSYEIQIFSSVLIDRGFSSTPESAASELKKVRSIIHERLMKYKDRKNFDSILKRANRLYRVLKHHFKHMTLFVRLSGSLVYGSFDSEGLPYTNPVPENDSFELCEYEK